MIAEFSKPLQAMLRPDNKRYQEPEFEKSALTEEVLISQLEGLWPGLEKLPAHRQRAIHQLLSRIRRFKAHDSRWSFLTLGATMPLDDHVAQTDFVVTRKPTQAYHEAATPHFDGESLAMIEEVATKHAFTATVCIALIAKAKQTSGILPSSDFLWARSKDLHFWRLINGYGRFRHRPEVVGAFAHFDLECKQGKPVSTTYFELAKIEE
jgi:hypothetical protein